MALGKISSASKVTLRRVGWTDDGNVFWGGSGRGEEELKESNNVLMSTNKSMRV